MDFLEIRRKAKERAETRARAVAAGAPPALTAEPLPVAIDADERPRADRDEWPGPPASPPADDVPPPDYSRLVALDDVAQVAAEVGGRLTPVPELPPWGEALADVREEPAERVGLEGVPTVRSAAPPPLWSSPPAPPRVTAPLDPLDEFFYREDEAAPGLPDLDFAARAAPRPAEVVDPQREYLTFLLGDEEYAVDIESVREVLKAPVITDVPRAPRHVLGVIMVRGDVIGVFDPRRRLGLPEVDRIGAPRVLVCDDGAGPVGLLVDRVSQVVRLRASEVESRPQGIGNVSAEYISAIGRQAGRMFILLDLPVVLRGKAAAASQEAP